MKLRECQISTDPWSKLLPDIYFSQSIYKGWRNQALLPNCLITQSISQAIISTQLSHRWDTIYPVDVNFTRNICPLWASLESTDVPDLFQVKLGHVFVEMGIWKTCNFCKSNLIVIKNYSLYFKAEKLTKWKHVSFHCHRNWRWEINLAKSASIMNGNTGLQITFSMKVYPLPASSA